MIQTSTDPVSVEILEASLKAWLRYYELQQDCHFYSSEAWVMRGEVLGEGASLHLTTEGDLYMILNGYRDDSAERQNELELLLNKLGYWYELGYAWSVHFYSVEA